MKNILRRIFSIYLNIYFLFFRTNCFFQNKNPLISKFTPKPHPTFPRFHQTIKLKDQRWFWEAQLLCSYIDVSDLLSYSFTGRLTNSSLSPSFVDRFGRSIRFCQFYKEAITDSFIAYSHVFRGVLNFKLFQRAEILWTFWTLFYFNSLNFFFRQV